jgi:hypothetical protein
LEADYAADSLQVYYRGKPLTNDPPSFRVLEFGIVPANAPAK